MESDDEDDTRSTRTLSSSSGCSDHEDLATYSEDENSQRRRRYSTPLPPASQRFSTATTPYNSDSDDDDDYVLVGYPPVEEKRLRAEIAIYGGKTSEIVCRNGGFDEDFEDLTDDELNEAGYIPRRATIPRTSPHIRKKVRSKEDNPQDPVPNPNSILAWREAKKLSQKNCHGSQQAEAYRDDMHSSQHTSASSPFPPDPRNSQSTHGTEPHSTAKHGRQFDTFYFGRPRYTSAKQKKMPPRTRDNSATPYFNGLPYTQSKSIPSRSSNRFHDSEDAAPPPPTSQERGYKSRSPPNPGASLVDVDDGRLQAFAQASSGALHPGLTTESRMQRRGKYPVPLVCPPSSRPTRDQTYQTMTQYPPANGPIPHHGSRLQPSSNNLRSIYQANDRVMHLPRRDNMDEMADDAEGRRTSFVPSMTTMEILDFIPSSDGLSHRATERPRFRNRSRDSVRPQYPPRGSVWQGGRRDDHMLATDAEFPVILDSKSRRSCQRKREIQ